MKRGNVSSAEVAREAGCSRTTVSFVLNNTPGKNISEETRQRVLAVAERLGYIPNENARKLVMTKERAVGFFVCHPKSIYSDAFIIRLLEGITQVLNKRRVQLVLQPLKLKDMAYAKLAKEDRVDGIILTNTHDNDRGIPELIRKRVPFVVIGDLTDKTIPQVDVDTRKTVRELTLYLAGLGHKRIAMITHAPLTFWAAQKRLDAFRQTLLELKIPFPGQYLRVGDFTEESGYLEAKKLLSLPKPPTAIFAGNDIIAYGVYKAVKDLGLKIPDNVSVAGFDDDVFSKFLNPPLTTMNLPAAGLGATAAQLLIDILDNGTPLPERRPLILPTRISVRDSCKILKGSS